MRDCSCIKYKVSGSRPAVEGDAGSDERSQQPAYEVYQNVVKQRIAVSECVLFVWNVLDAHCLPERRRICVRVFVSVSVMMRTSVSLCVRGRRESVCERVTVCPIACTRAHSVGVCASAGVSRSERTAVLESGAQV